MAAKLDLIKDLIEDSIDKFSNYNNPEKPYIEIRPIVDAIVLLLEKNIALIIKNEQGKLVSTYKIDNKEINKKNSTEFKFGSYKIFIAEIHSNGFSKLTETDEKSLDNLLEWLLNEHELDLINSIRYNSKKEGKDYKIDFIEYSIEDTDSPEDKDEIKNEIRKIISNAIRIFENNRTIRIDEIDIPNVFHVIRYASNQRDKYKYSAQILLSTNQRTNISKYLQTISKNFENIDLLEDSLDKNSTSIADECFKYECVRFENYSENTSDYQSASDRIRHELENLIYSKIASGNKAVFYVPIHLNGAPWMAIYRIVPEDKNIDYISFYRNKISIIANQIRHDAYKAYFNLIRNKIEELGNNESLLLSVKIERINNYLKLLSAFFSFYIPMFPSKLEKEDEFYLYLNRLVKPDYEFNFYMNSIWKNEIDYDNISVTEFEKRLKERLNRIYLKIAIEKEEEKRRDLVNSSTHALKTELETSLIPLKNKLLTWKGKYALTNLEILHLDLLDFSVEQYYVLTGLINLISKNEDINKLVESGKKDKLFVINTTEVNIKDYFENLYKSLNSETKLQVDVGESMVLGINIFNIWLGKEMLNTFLNMVFQNADQHAKFEDDGKKLIEIKFSQNQIIFLNKTWYEQIEINTNKLTGNLYLFSELINTSKEIKMDIEAKNQEFKIILSWIK